ncbi:MAG: glycoside hydrolase family 3 protein [Defluviitaleaceae bacterium]|nr:glycoside hydrolase family 3 protein [Defluviitaleaceae bacterium]
MRFFLVFGLLVILAACGGTEPDIGPVYAAVCRQQLEPPPTHIPATPSPQPVVIEVTPTPTPRPNPCFLCPSTEWIASLTLREKIGQLIMPRLPWQTTAMTPALEQWFTDYPVGGIILFADNVNSIQQVHALISDMQAASTHPLFIATDEEGGRVSRVGRLFDEPVPPAYEIGLTGDSDYAFEMGQITGQWLKLLGINMNFAPVADVWTNPANTVIGNRAFGRDPELAGLMVEYTIRGLQSSGVLAVAKHFPGHGDTYEDSHYLLAVYPHDRARFDEIEAPPFIRSIQAGVDGMMIGHIATPELQNPTHPLNWMAPWLASGTLPATFSDFWLQDVLREEMGFDGLIITDALEMRALTDHFTPEQIALGTFIAGADILLMPTDVTATFDALYEAFHDGLLNEERLHQSLQRIYLARKAVHAN